MRSSLAALQVTAPLLARAEDPAAGEPVQTLAIEPWSRPGFFEYDRH